jgi:hypothetical protein
MTSPPVEQTNQHSLPRRELDRLEIHSQRQLNGRACEFRSVPRGRGLILRGRGRSYYGKQLAKQAVVETVILPIVANEIEVT